MEELENGLVKSSPNCIFRWASKVSVAFLKIENR